jgi:3-dehydroquinate synthetase
MAKWEFVKSKLPLIEQLAEEEKTDKEIRAHLNIGHNTWHLWLKDKTKQELKDALSNGRAKSIGFKVKTTEDSLYKLANGYEYEEEDITYKIVPVKVDQNGVVVEMKQTIMNKVTHKKKMPPSAFAIKMLLANRAPEKWMEKSKLTVNTQDVTKIQKLNDESEEVYDFSNLTDEELLRYKELNDKAKKQS